jgi:hypothetical protein
MRRRDFLLAAAATLATETLGDKNMQRRAGLLGAAGAKKRTPPTGGPLTLQPTQPATFVYTVINSTLDSYKTPGAMVVAGRDNYGDTAFQQVNAAGGHVLIYLDAVLDNTVGRYHDLLYNSSVYGGAVPRFPGNRQANSIGYLPDVRVGSVLHDKLEPILRLMASENPHMAGYFADDLGSRTNFPLFTWESLTSQEQIDYRNGIIAIAQTWRNVCDDLGKIVIFNGSWNSGTIAANGGGYPNVGVHGCSLADGGCFELWKGFNAAFRTAMAASAQWSTESAMVNGDAIHLAIANDAADRADWADEGTVAYVAEQTSYASAVTPWGSFHSIGLGSSGGGGGGGTVTFDAVGPSSAGASATSPTATASWSHTCSGTNRLLIVGVAVGDASTGAMTLGVTYNGVAMTSVARVNSNNQTAGFVELFRLINPPTGANTVVVTPSATANAISAGSISFTGVHQTTPLGTAATAFGSSGTPTVAVTATTSGNMIVDAVCNGAAVTSSNQTQRWLRNTNTSTAAGNGAAATAAATGSSVTMSYATTSDWWGIAAVEVKGA